MIETIGVNQIGRLVQVLTVIQARDACVVQHEEHTLERWKPERDGDYKSIEMPV